ncbi:hypothetical protein CDL12_07582 [Handroanthus impetiginosus]|uniref:Tetraspanin family integral membrane protein n=1 Tax=Handroanthus impetiginosus TaxID=429701 RepID=A0A2G9HQD6_9LAMI|nr:hypothetical protein CDL12_07582 [Handroanthus impetiginosus]
MVKNLLKSSLKVLNSAIGMGGIAVIAYGVLMIRIWQPDVDDHSPSSSHHNFTLPWFFHAFLGAGVALCATACLGHIAANTAHIFCLSCYISIVLLLLIFETIIVANLFIDSHWEKELPKDLCDRLDDFKDFVDSNDEIWKWVAWFIFLLQGICVLLATVLRTQETNEVDGHSIEDEDEDEDEGDDIAQTRFPLLGSSGRRPSSDSNIV